MDIFGTSSLPVWLTMVLSLLVVVYMTVAFMTPVANEPHTKKMGFHGEQVRLVGKYGKVFGFFEGRDPSYMISEVKILKQILVKDFGNFVNRREFFMRGPISKFLFDTRGDYWKRIRNLVTPTFTSGKMRQMDGTIDSLANELEENLIEITQKDGIIDAKIISGSFVMDVIAAVAFGIKTNSQKNNNDPFVKEARKAFDVSMTSPLLLVFFLVPHLGKVLDKMGVCMFPASSINFFRHVVNSALQLRKNENGNRKVDFLKLMMEAHMSEIDQETKTELRESGVITETTHRELTSEEILGQSYGFFLAGYETTATTLGFLLYNFATNLEIQEKARAEVFSLMEQHPVPTYDSVQRMHYVDMCISETLRMFPPLPAIDRVAAKDTTIEGVFFAKGVTINIPIYALHHDPEVWPDPYRFNPDRFTPEAKASRDPYHFIPFGYGPRLCVGMRLAQLELKIALARLLKNFRFLPCKDTQIPLKLKPGFFLNGEKGLRVKVEEL